MIEFIEEKQVFFLETEKTCYGIRLFENQYLLHLGYGKREEKSRFLSADWSCNTGYRAFSPYAPEFGPDISLDTARCEYSGFNSGDFRTTAIRIRNPNGDSVTRFSYRGYRIFFGRRMPKGLPCGQADEKTETLELELFDEVVKCALYLYYTLFPECDVISRSFRLENRGTGDVRLEKATSLTLDLAGHDFELLSLPGLHCLERRAARESISYGNKILCSRRGVSGHQMNPFFALCTPGAGEREGEAYGFNFCFSGNFCNEIEVDPLGNTRVQVGLGGEMFCQRIPAGGYFDSPEGIMTYSGEGLGGMSRNFHEFVRSHILPGTDRRHPVVLNTWEASYFDINEQKLLRYAEIAAACKIEVLVVDDGWFRSRNSEESGLGDWQPDIAKFRGGFAAFAENLEKLGIGFGIWIEPEMISPDSELYRIHPDWCLGSRERKKSLSRSQLVLDLTNPKVLAYLKDTFSRTFAGIPLRYVKWDMNRHLTEVGSALCDAGDQASVGYRYQLGVYELLDWFRKNFPGIVLETCAGGGGRFDLGMLAFSEQIWTSDNTFPDARQMIQAGTSLAYPCETMSCHVTKGSEETEEIGELRYRFLTALGGVLGYELDPTLLSPAQLGEITGQILRYKEYAHLIVSGEYHRILDAGTGNYSAFYYVSRDRREFLAVFLQRKGETPAVVSLPLVEAQEDWIYTETEKGLRFSGKALRAFSLLSAPTAHSGEVFHWIAE